MRERAFVILIYRAEAAVELASFSINAENELIYNGSLTDSLDMEVGEIVGTVVPLADVGVAGVFGNAGLVDWVNRSESNGVATFEAPTGARVAAPSPTAFSGFFTVVDSQGRLGFERNDGTGIVFMAQETDAGIMMIGAHYAVNHAGGAVDGEGNFTRCFLLNGPELQNNEQLYCNDGPFVGYSR